MLKSHSCHPDHPDHGGNDDSIFYQPWVTRKVKKWMSRMTLDEKIAQTFVPASIPGDDQGPEQYLGFAKDHQVGGFLVTIPPTPDGRGITAEGRKEYLDKLKVATNYKIPAFYSTDNTHGAAYGQNCIAFPHGYGYNNLSVDRIKKHAEEEGRATAAGSLETGINMVYSPYVSSDFNQLYGRLYESPGRDAYKCSVFAEAFVKGAQNIKECKKGRETRRYMAGVVTCCKHFFGEGYCQYGVQPPGNSIQFGTAFMGNGGSGDKEVLLKNTAAGFAGGVSAETGAIMIAYNAIQENPLPNSYGNVQPYVNPLTLNKDYIELLRHSNKGNGKNFDYQIGFNHKGLIISDADAAIGALTNMGVPDFTDYPPTPDQLPNFIWENYYSANAYALAHGMDMLMQSVGTYRQDKDGNYIYAELVKFIREHVHVERIDNAVENILRVKAVANLESKVFRHAPSRKEQALAAYELAFDTFVYTTNLLPKYYDEKYNPYKVYNSFPIPGGPILTDASKTVLILGREASPFDGGFLWNAFYDDIGLLMGGWSFYYSSTGISGNRSIFFEPFDVSGENVNQLFAQSRVTIAGRSKRGTPIMEASTILDGFNNAGIKTIIVNDSTDFSLYNKDNSYGVICLGEFPYQETVGELDKSSNSCATLSVDTISQEEADTFNPDQGVKLSPASYENLKKAHYAGIQLIAIINSGRDWRTWRTNAPLNSADNDPFGSMTLAQVTTSIVFTLLPGTSGGDAIVNFLYDTPYKQGLESQWKYTPQNVYALQPPPLGDAKACPFPDPLQGDTSEAKQISKTGQSTKAAPKIRGSPLPGQGKTQPIASDEVRAMGDRKSKGIRSPY